MRVDILPAHVIATYRSLYPAYSPSDVYFAATTASRSWRGALIELEGRARAEAPAFAYQLDWRAPAEGGIFGAPHTLDIPLVFGTLETSEWIGARTPEAAAMSRTDDGCALALCAHRQSRLGALRVKRPHHDDFRQSLTR
jgi:para-nitrobenzyl esterase